MATWVTERLYEGVVRPFVTQLKNRLGNVRVEKTTSGFNFFNAENVPTSIDMTKDILALSSNLGHVNPNPYFFKGDLDYKSYINGNTRKLVNDIVASGSPKSLYIKGGGDSLMGTELFPVDATLEYRASVTVRAKNPSDKPQDGSADVSYYVGVVSLDVDKLAISPQHLTTREGTGGSVVDDVAVGDTTIKVQGDFSKWYNGSSAHQRSFRVHKLRSDGTYGYIGPSGTYYDPMGYTRDMMFYAWDENGLTDNGDGTFTINLNKGCQLAIPAGSKICNCFSGASYNYWISSKRVKINDKWHTFSSPWRVKAEETPDADGYVGTNYGDVFRNGTAYCKLLVLPNYYYYEDGDSVGYVYAVNTDLEVWYGKIALQFRHKQ